MSNIAISGGKIVVNAQTKSIYTMRPTTMPSTLHTVQFCPHVHTDRSDGVLPWEQIVNESLGFGVEALARGDHDTNHELILGAYSQEIEDADKLFQIGTVHGFELTNTPGHDHALVGFIGDDAAELRKILAAFRWFFIGLSSAFNDLPLVMREQLMAWGAPNGRLRIPRNTFNEALFRLAASLLQDLYPTQSYLYPSHPCRERARSRGGWEVSWLREHNDTAPDVFYGAEFMPGHHRSAFRGNYDRFFFFDNTRNAWIRITTGARDTLEQMVDVWIAAQTQAHDPKNAILDFLIQDLPRQRTHGGVDFYGAIVGGVWDSLLAEGRKYWFFGNSDFHRPDAQHFPGQYHETNLLVAQKTKQGLFDALRLGRAFVSQGQLINRLDYSIQVGDSIGIMGDTIHGAAAHSTQIRILFKSPKTNHNGDTPRVDHVDLIAGRVTGKLQPSEYAAESTPHTQVIKTFTAADWTVVDGTHYMSLTLPPTPHNMYYRLRLMNKPANSAGFTDMQGNPVIDTPVTAGRGTHSNARAWEFLQAYSNPIFVMSGR